MTYPQPLKIAGVGHYLPKRVVQSSEVEKLCDLEEGWIERKQGVRERRWIEDETTSFMAAQAATEAMADAGMEFTDIDLLMNASGTPEQLIPDTACLVQRELGLGVSGISCMSIHTTCLSFLSGLDVCSNLLTTGRYENILLVSSYISSNNLNFKHPESSTLFGDLAAAAVLTRTPECESSCVHAAHFETYGDGAVFTQVPGGGTRLNPIFPETRMEDFYFQMDGPAVFKLAVGVLYETARAVLAKAGKTASDIDWMIPHQANIRIMQSTARKLKISMDKVVVTVDQHGNTSAASIPLALDTAVRSGQVKPGELLLLEAVGGGFTWGAVLLKL